LHLLEFLSIISIRAIFQIAAGGVRARRCGELALDTGLPRGISFGAAPA
jgi:hypothetical protein